MDDLDQAALRRLRRAFVAQPTLVTPADVYASCLAMLVGSLALIDAVGIAPNLFSDALDYAYEPAPSRTPHPVHEMTEKYLEYLGDLAPPIVHLAFAGVIGLAGLMLRPEAEQLVVTAIDCVVG